MNFNKTIIAGNLTKKPEKMVTESGTTIVNFSVATNEKYKDKETTEFHNVVAFGKTAELIHQYLDKGSNALFEGRLQTRSYEKDGNKKYITEIIVNNVVFGPKKVEEDINVDEIDL